MYEGALYAGGEYAGGVYAGGVYAGGVYAGGVYAGGVYAGAIGLYPYPGLPDTTATAAKKQTTKFTIDIYSGNKNRRN
jgi:hypothetical protein